MGHDGNVGCDWSEYIMSRSRADHGQTSWSSCSKASLASQSVQPAQSGSFTSILAGCRDAVSRLGCLGDRPSKAQAGLWDHNSTHGVPGYFITAEEQCK